MSALHHNRHGGTYIDILPDFRGIPNPEQGLLPGRRPSQCQGARNDRGYVGQGVDQRRSSRTQSRPQPQNACNKENNHGYTHHSNLWPSAWPQRLFSNFSRSRVWRSIVLFAASLVFLGLLAHNPIRLSAAGRLSPAGLRGLLLFERGWSRSVVWSILAVILVYVWLKKYTFLPEGSFLHYSVFHAGALLHLLSRLAPVD